MDKKLSDLKKDKSTRGDDGESDAPDARRESDDGADGKKKLSNFVKKGDDPDDGKKKEPFRFGKKKDDDDPDEDEDSREDSDDDSNGSKKKLSDFAKDDDGDDYKVDGPTTATGKPRAKIELNPPMESLRIIDRRSTRRHLES